MLYLTTRSKDDAYTPRRALMENRSPDGGLFVPMQEPYFGDLLQNLASNPFCENVAEVLNVLTGEHLSALDVEFAIGTEPYKLVDLDTRTIVGEMWHNFENNFRRTALNLKRALIGAEPEETTSDWLMISCRIAMLFGLFGKMNPADLVDIAVPAGNFSAVMAVWYARSWGLPVGNIVICCNENNGLWSLFHQGEIRTDGTVIKTTTPSCDCVVPADLERLIYAVLGENEAKKFAEISARGKTYYLDEERFKQLKRGMYVSVVGTDRIPIMKASMKVTQNYDADLYTVLSYIGLMDYRAGTRSNPKALILAEERI